MIAHGFSIEERVVANHALLAENGRRTRVEWVIGALIAVSLALELHPLFHASRNQRVEGYNPVQPGARALAVLIESRIAQTSHKQRVE